MTSRASFKENIGGLTVIQAVYAFVMALGLREVFVGSRAFLTNVVFGTEGLFTIKTAMMFVLLVNIMLLGLRFFWVPRNLRGLVFVAAQERPQTSDKKPNIPLKNITVAFHLVMILLHGSIFYFLCVEFEYITFVASSALSFDGSSVTGYVLIHVALLFVNAGWIALIQYQEGCMRDAAIRATNASAAATSVWWRNNLICGVIALAPLALLASCGPSGSDCFSTTGPPPPDIVSIMPFSPDHIYGAIVWLFGATGTNAADLPLVITVISLFVLIANSGFDLLRTGGTYLLFEEVEWIDQPANPPPDKSDGPAPSSAAATQKKPASTP